MEAVDGDPKAVRLLGVEVASQLGAELLEAGAPGLHLITMNRSVSDAGGAREPRAPLDTAERVRRLRLASFASATGAR